MQSLATLGLGVALAAVLALTQGRPDLAAAWAFFAGGPASQAAAVGLLALMAWALAAGTVAVGLVGAVRELFGRTRSYQRRQLAWAVSVFLLGLLVLTAGLHKHLEARTLPLGGGSMTEAKQLAR